MCISPNEQITRFILHSRHFTASTGRVSPRVFLPSQDKNEISVYRIRDMSCDSIWNIGSTYVETCDRTIRARADLFASAVYEINLKIVPTVEPHESHANITPLPEASDKTGERTRRDIARQLALSSKLKTKPI